MAKSTRQYVFEGMELLPEGLVSFVEKRLESSIKGHWQVQVVERYRGLRPNKDGEINWDQPCLSVYHPHPLYVVCTHFPE